MVIINSKIIKAVVTLGNYIYAIGGLLNNEYLKTVERYDVLNDKWEFVASMKYEREFPEAVVFNKKIYVFGENFFLYLKFLIKIFMMFVIICIIVM